MKISRHPSQADKVTDSENLSPTFGRLLRKYRRARGLNQIALGSRSRIDNSAISRFEGGKQLPHKTVFDRIVAALNLSIMEQNRLESALQREILEKNLLSAELYLSVDEFIALESEQVETVRKLRLEGKPKSAAEQASRHAQWSRIFARRIRRENTQHTILNILADLLMEQGKSLMDFAFPNEAWLYMNQIIAEQRAIVEIIRAPRLHLQADLNTEATLYISGDYIGAHVICRRVLANRDQLESIWRPEILRAGAINAGYLQDESGIRLIASAIERIAGELKPSDLITCAYMLEGLARGLGSLRNTKALRTIEEAQRVLDIGRQKDSYSSLRGVQLIRTQLQVMKALGETNKADLERIGSRGLIIAFELGYMRYYKEIKQILDSTLN